MRSFKALHASHDKMVIGEGHEVRLAREGRCVQLQSIKNRLGARGKRRGYHKGERRGVEGDINRAQVNKHNTAMDSTQGRRRKRRSRLSLLNILREPLEAFEQTFARRGTTTREKKQVLEM